MERSFIQATEFTPMVNFDPAKGLMEMKGNSTPSDSQMFYSSVISQLEEYVANDTRGIIANMAFRYFNTSSSKCLYSMFKKLTVMQKDGRTVTVSWYYWQNDDEMYGVGKDFAELMNLKFNFIEFAA